VATEKLESDYVAKLLSFGRFVCPAFCDTSMFAFVQADGEQAFSGASCPTNDGVVGKLRYLPLGNRECRPAP
jgi:hypothetical protein